MVKKYKDMHAASTLLDVLQRGGIAVAPCDTIYGIIGRCSDTEEKIRLCKGRDEKPFIRLIPNVEAVSLYCDRLPPGNILSMWPGPLTLVVGRRSGGTVALRVPDDPFLLSILTDLNDHLFSTSVNITGEDSLWEIAEIVRTFGDRVDLILDNGDLPGNRPSTVLDVTQRPFSILRQGACTVPPEFLD